MYLRLKFMIFHGTVLPKGHRYVDADKLLDNAIITEDEESNSLVKQYYNIDKKVFDNAVVAFNTIEIDADKENTDENN